MEVLLIPQYVCTGNGVMLRRGSFFSYLVRDEAAVTVRRNSSAQPLVVVAIWWANRLCWSTVNSTRRKYGRTPYGAAMTRSRIANLTRSEFVLSPNSSMILYLW